MTRATELTRTAIDSGNLLLAYDIAHSAIKAGEDSADLRHLLVLALARMGDAERTMELYHEYGLEKSPNAHHRSIVARILKDAALTTVEDADREQALREAFLAYQQIYLDSGDAYPGINAATLAFLGGQKPNAKKIASDLLDLDEIADPKDYYAAASRAEALLIIGQIDQVADTLSTAAGLPGANSGAKSSSYRQLALVAREAGLDVDAQKALLAAIAPPSVIFYCGHMFREDNASEEALRASIDQFLDRHNAGFAYGALAAGSDILIAEAILRRGGELHLIFPFDKDDFIAQSVMPAGSGWAKRFEKCLSAATSVSFATEMHYVGDPRQFGYASKVGMGMAKLRAQYLGIAARQLAIWDGVAPTGPAGTGADVVTWKRYGGETETIEANGLDRNLDWPVEPEEERDKRILAAILFTDFPGFSKLAEAALPAFWKGIMGRMAGVLADHESELLARNSWGDALLAVTGDAPKTAQIAIEIQSALGDFDYAELGLAETSGMRIGVHYGPAYEAIDPITKKITFYGTEVSRAARIEPVTPPGAVFVTAPFAAILALEAPDKFRCSYVGNIEFAKGYGIYPIYRLTARSRSGK